jgi:predicted Zn-dependent protease
MTPGGDDWLQARLRWAVVIGSRRLTLSLALAVALATGCPTAPPLESPDARYGESEDEQRLIRDADRLEAEMREKAIVFDDRELVAYLERVAQPLFPPSTGGVRFHFIVVREPTINAFALANGGIVVHSGLLAAVQNEAQLAMVLGHEIAHTNYRHQLNGLHDFQRKTVFAKLATTTLGPAAAAFTGGLGLTALELMVGFTYVAVVNGYSREDEQAADLYGLRAIARAGYASEQGPQMFLRLNEMADYDAFTTFFYGNHPSNTAREKYTRALIESGEVPRNPDGRLGETELRAATRRAVEENVRLRLQARHYEYARLEVERAYGYYGDSASLRYLEGEIHRLRAEDPEGTAREAAMRAHDPYDSAALEPLRAHRAEELDAAEKSYTRSLELDPKYFKAQRGLGEIALERGQDADALKLLDGYLDADPNAPDYRYVERLLKRIKAKQENPR